MCTWRSMHEIEIHQVHTHIVQQLKFLNFIPLNEPAWEIHRQSTLQLELDVQQWHSSFCNLLKAQRDHIQSLVVWHRLCLFQFSLDTGKQAWLYSHARNEQVPGCRKANKSGNVESKGRGGEE
ncbi:hypothetical protein GQ457_06G035990 [Hibiscus cannabinus]